MSSEHFARELVRQHISDLAKEASRRAPQSWAQAPLAERTSQTSTVATALRRLADRLDPPVEATSPALASGRHPNPC
jgi:hypothetical protein